jgi:hypothetical protein
MPPMVLLPLVQHAVESVRGEPCALIVGAAVDNGRMFVTVVGPVVAFPDSDGSSRLAQVAERIDALYGESAQLSLRSIAHDRSQATLEVPYEHTDRTAR